MEQLIEIKDVYKSYGDIQVLKGVSLNISKGEIVAIIGISGCGKSTLIRCISGLERIQSGEILVSGTPINGKEKRSKETRKKIAMVFQSFNLFPHYTILENIMKPCIIVNKIDRESAKNIAIALLKKVRLEDKIDCYPYSLSGGQKQRVAIARALAMDPEIVLFDEPTSALDPEIAYEVLDTIKALGEEGLTMVIVTHQIKFIRNIATRIVFIDEGVICEDGSPQEVLDNSNNNRLKKFLMRLDESL
ncbi:amino acid ABC transporter ATP-binding protein [Clostridium sp. CS001]|uniref:amino acid ABC transporter ATP-binding protein n=1 Tax=Clostridium sp. CS001 TaxID=2880648 RepID=UPI001CF2D7D0|nr:amino acid ABC transporter ATP-binding protein [Clostridium sp. CS001]MCB2289690.1 amino acid ABC transporter ATP-binding protein [Clostridium sp. CS001]